MDTYTKQKKWADRRRKRHEAEAKRKESLETNRHTFKPVKISNGKNYSHIKSRLFEGTTGLEVGSSPGMGSTMTSPVTKKY